MLLWYLKRLWLYRHYQFFPFVFLVVGFLAYTRWPKTKPIFRESKLATALLILGTGLAIMSSISFSQVMVTASFVAFVASLFARINDQESDNSLVVLAIPLLLLIRLPFGLDDTLITGLQRISSICTSQFLDLLGYRHLMDGNVLVIPGIKNCGIERACSGVQSFFTLVFCTIVISVSLRRSFLRSVLLLLSAIFWAVLMNVVRITVIPIADVERGIDLRSGVPHETLGYIVLAIAILAVLSTDYFLEFILGPISVESVGARGIAARFIRFWNYVAAGVKDEDRVNTESTAPATVKTIYTRKVKIALWITAGIVVCAGLFQVGEMIQGYLMRSRSRGFDTSYDAGIKEESLIRQDETETRIGSFSKVGFESEKRDYDSVLGERSRAWVFADETQIARLSLDFTFPRWHDLRTCYKGIGWTLMKSETRSDHESGWTYSFSEFERPTGEKCLLAFSLFNSEGTPFNTTNDIESKGLGRLAMDLFFSRQYEKQIQNGPYYQIQLFMPLPRDITDEDREKCIAAFLDGRERVRAHFEKAHQEVSTSQ